MSYTLIQQFSTQHAQIEFSGPFKGEIMLWNTHFLTLKYYAKQQNILYYGLKQFIEINAIDPHNMDLTVALKVSKITPATIEKMIIMIKQYKNLSIGRHEYG